MISRAHFHRLERCGVTITILFFDNFYDGSANDKELDG